MEERSKLYIKDEDILNILKRLDDPNDETSFQDAIKTMLIVATDTRRFLRKINKNMQDQKVKVFKKPTGNEEDIIVGDNQ